MGWNSWWAGPTLSTGLDRDRKHSKAPEWLPPRKLPAADEAPPPPAVPLQPTPKNADTIFTLPY